MDGQFEILFWVMQACGACALIIQNAANFLPCGKRILKVQIVSALLWSAHYGLMGIQNVAVMCLAGAFRNWQSSKLVQRGLNRFNALYAVAIILFFMINSSNLNDLFPVIMVSLFYFRMTARDNLLKFHAYGFVCAVLWVSYSYYNGAWFGVMNDTIAASCAGLAFIQVYLKRKKASTIYSPHSTPLPA